MVPTGVFGFFDDPEINEMQKFDPALAKEQALFNDSQGRTGQKSPCTCVGQKRCTTPI